MDSGGYFGMCAWECVEKWPGFGMWGWGGSCGLAGTYDGDKLNFGACDKSKPFMHRVRAALGVASARVRRFVILGGNLLL